MTNENVTNQAPALPTKDVRETEKQEAAAVQALPEWKVSGIFSSHMVLQRERQIKVWGWSCHIGAKVTGIWDGEKAEGMVDENGRFEVSFSPRKASFEPTEMTIASEHGSDTFTDILVGDVWVLGGQSNAELNLEPCLVDTPKIAAGFDENHPFRLFTQTQGGAMECTEFHHVPSRDIIKPEWYWKRPDEAASRRFSAIGYYFAHLVAPEIKIPMGMVMMCAGGACLRELMPKELGNQLGYFTGANMPVGGYYNTLIAPLIGLQFKGQIFFQGESEGIWVEMAHSYGEDLAAFVEDERERFGFDFSFYNVQLSSYREECDDYFPHLYWVRASQHKALSLIPNSYLTVSRDLGSLPGEPDFAHSPHKFALTKRLAAQALAGDYGIGELDKTYSPLPKEAVCEGNTVKVTFTCVNGGLKTAENGEVLGFSFMDAEGKEIPSAAKIVAEDQVLVTVPEGAETKEVHYAMNNMAYLAQANLCGGTFLPVPAFAVTVK